MCVTDAAKEPSFRTDMPTNWQYDSAGDCAYIKIVNFEPQKVKTVHLERVEVLLDMDLDGNVLGIELLGDPTGTNPTVLKDLGKYLKTEPNP
jgi:uncharacterized protein YuzE